MIKKLMFLSILPFIVILLFSSILLIGGENGSGKDPTQTGGEIGGTTVTDIKVRLPYKTGVTTTLTQGYWTTLEEAKQWWGSVIPPYSSGMHRAVDYSSGYGTEIVPIIDGTIVYKGYSSGYGNYTIVETHIMNVTDGTIKQTIYTLYGHFSESYASIGQSVGRDSVLGLEGNTGLSTGSHVHIEISTSYEIGTLAGEERINYLALEREET